MRVVFCGASRFGLKVAEALSTMTCCELVGVVTAPQEFTISYRPSGVRNVLFADLVDFANSKNLPFQMIANGMNDPQVLKEVQRWKPDCFIVAGWYHLLPESWRRLAPAYGLHASILPDYSGGAPLVWAIINGENSTGITFFQFDNGVDSGPIVASKSTHISEADTIATVYARIEKLGLQLIAESVPHLANGTVQLTVQDGSNRRVFPQRSPEDGVINWSQSAQRIYDFVRAQTHPYPGAHTFINSLKLTIWSCELIGSAPVSANPGDIFKIGNDFYACCGDGQYIKLKDTSLEKTTTSHGVTDMNLSNVVKTL